MPIRPKQHQLEDLSRSKFSLTLPKEWVFRNKDKDYGIDGEVEIFDEGNNSTGLLFFVQLKATGANDQTKIKKIEINIDKLQYYNSLSIPVLIARYSETTDKFYTIWSHEIDLFYVRHSQKNITIKFSDLNEWSLQDKKNIVTFLEKRRIIEKTSLPLPIPCKIIIDEDVALAHSSALFTSKLRQALFEYDDIITPTTCSHDSFITIHIKTSEMSIRILGSPSCIFHNPQLSDDPGTILDLSQLIILGIASVLAQLELNDLAAKVVFTKSIIEKLSTIPYLTSRLLPHLIRSSFYEDALKFAASISTEHGADFIEIVTHASILASLNRNNTKKASAIEQFLLHCAKRDKDADKEKYGHDLYNIANFYRSTNSPRKAIKYYLKARKLQPIYNQQGYFFAELAGCFFHIKKFSISASLYKKALEIDPTDDINPLYADALMLSGQYQKSLEIFNECMDTDDQCSEEWQLKAHILRIVIEKFHIKAQNRNEKLANEFAELKFCTSEEEADLNLGKALEADYLCPLAWHKIGLKNVQISNMEDAAFAFILSSLISQTAVEGWVNAVICLFNTSCPSSFIITTIKAAYNINGELFRSALYLRLAKDNTDQSKFFSVIEEIIATCSEDKVSPELRVIDPTGKMKNILPSETS